MNDMKAICLKEHDVIQINIYLVLKLFCHIDITSRIVKRKEDKILRKLSI